MKTLICYGDSNTYGFDPRSYLGDRYRKTERWTGILDESNDFHVVNFGQNGREIPINKWDLRLLLKAMDDNPDFDNLIVMLGSNDVLFHRDMTPEKLKQRMDFLLQTLLSYPALQQSPDKLLLLAPPQPRPPYFHTGMTGAEPDIPVFSELYEGLANQYHTSFASVEDWNLEFAHDGVHFTPLGHQIFAKKLRAIL